MYAVTGATGQLGRLVIAALKDKGLADKTIALVRDPAKAADLGVATRAFDYDKPEALASALDGVDRLLLISANEVGRRARQHRNVIAAAQAAGVGHIVYTSLVHADTSPLGLAEEHRQTEAALKASGIPYTILRNSWYTENYTGSLKGAVAAGAVVSAAGDAKVATASRPDLAQAAANVLAGEGHENAVYELAGAPYTLAELAAEAARQTGKPVGYKSLPKDEYAKLLESFGVPAVMADVVASADVDAQKGALFDDSGDLDKLLGRPSETLTQAVAKALQ